jgi:hypothetical protein
MESRARLIIAILNREFARNEVSIFALHSALYGASKVFLKSKNHKSAIRLGKRILDTHRIWENE